MSIVRADSLQASIATPVKQVTNAWGHTRSDLFGTKYIWAIDNFSFRKEATGTFIKSPVFTLSLPDKSIDLVLKMYPSGDSPSSMDCVSAFVQVITNDVSINAKVKIGLINCFGNEKALYSSDKSTLLTYLDRLGASRLIQRSSLLTVNEYKYANDMLTLFCEFSVVRESVNVRCSNFKGNIVTRSVSEDIAELFINQKFSDLTLLINEKAIQVHKVVLAARSPLFAEMMCHDPTITTIDIKELSYRSVLEFLRYIYTGQVEDIDDISQDLLLASIKYKMDGLQPICYDNIIANTKEDNAAEILIFAHNNNLAELKEATLSFFKKHAKAIMKTEGLLKLKRTCPELIMNDLFETLAL